jgi:hypothetical protein
VEVAPADEALLERVDPKLLGQLEPAQQPGRMNPPRASPPVLTSSNPANSSSGDSSGVRLAGALDWVISTSGSLRARRAA